MDSMKEKHRKHKIPAAFREQIWCRDFGKKFEGKCPTCWCNNNITVFDFHAGHNIPESKGGQTIPDNLIPICARCNLSMGDRYTFTEWSGLNERIKAKQAAESVKSASCLCWQ
jgi:5-methylcytosine-specific restriction endonuclease McrA